MGYTALYRKWRPAHFSEVRGQDAIITTLKNEILSGRIGHAYLFCGTRGTGKTSVAKIFARAVNCETPVEGEPCGCCPMCRAIDSGASVNVVEMDAASNNGVDNVREIRDEVQYPPSQGKYRVYIIDEVHMLSTAAFNALLKTLEEPPAYVIFVLATTEPQKIPATILSRCQQFDFHRIGPEVIEGRLREICDREEAGVEDAALRYIVRKADGAMRDAISLLDQALAFNPDGCLTYEKALSALGAVDSEVFSLFLENMAGGRTVEMLNQIEEIVMSGKEIGQFTQDFIWYLRNLLLVQAAPVDNELLGIGAEDRKRLENEGRMLSQNQIMRYIRLFSELYNQMRQALNKRVLFEVTAIKAMQPEMEQETDALLSRLEKLEKNGGAGSGALAVRLDALEKKIAEGIAISPKEAARGEAAAPKTVKVPRALFEEWSRLKQDWTKILMELDRPAQCALAAAFPEPRAAGELTLAMSREKAELADAISAPLQLETAIEKLYNKKIKIFIRYQETDEPEPEFLAEDIGSVFQNIDITEEPVDDGWGQEGDL